jgi:hypothetical protein
MFFTIKRAWIILIRPKQVWISITNENFTIQRLLISYTIPFIAFATMTHFARSFYILSDHSFWISLSGAILYFSTFLFSVYLTTRIILIVQKSFEISTDQKSIFVLISYSLTPAYLAETIANINYSLNAFYIFSFYAVYLLWNGSGVLIWISDKQKVPFVLTSLIIFFLSKTILYIYIIRIIYLFQ